MICGNCFERHPTVYEVRLCHDLAWFQAEYGMTHTEMLAEQADADLVARLSL